MQSSDSENSIKKCKEIIPKVNNGRDHKTMQSVDSEKKIIIKEHKEIIPDVNNGQDHKTLQSSDSHNTIQSPKTDKKTSQIQENTLEIKSNKNQNIKILKNTNKNKTAEQK